MKEMINISPEVRQKYSELVDLILNSNSLEDTEKQYWIELLPSLREEKRDELRNIFLEEAEEIKRIDADHPDEATLKIKKAQAKRKQRLAAELQSEEAESEVENELLNDIESQF